MEDLDASILTEEPQPLLLTDRADMLALLASVQKQASDGVKSREKIDWHKVAVGSVYSAEICRATYLSIRRKTINHIPLDQEVVLMISFAENQLQKAFTKRPPSAYNLFVANKFEQYKQKNGITEPTAVIGVLSQKWKSLSERKKRKYVAKANDLKADYEKKIKLAESAQPSPSKSMVNGFADDRIEPIDIFIDAQREAYQTKHPKLTFDEVTRKLSKRFRKLDDHQRQVYIDKSEQTFLNQKKPKPISTSSKSSDRRRQAQAIENEIISLLGPLPKQPPKSILLFYKSIVHDSQEFASIPTAKLERSIAMAKHWKEMSAQEKNDYRIKYKKKLIKYTGRVDEYLSTVDDVEKRERFRNCLLKSFAMKPI